jgi:hypothetical protein
LLGDRVPIFVSPNLGSKATVVLLVQGSGPLLPGFWARTLCINDVRGLHWGSMLPFLEQCDARGWGVVILNPNVDAPGVGRDHHQVLHALRHIISPTQAVGIIAHGRGGSSTADALKMSPADAANVRAIALTDSMHCPLQTTDTFNSLAIHWVCCDCRFLLLELLLLLMLCRWHLRCPLIPPWIPTIWIARSAALVIRRTPTPTTPPCCLFSRVWTHAVLHLLLLLLLQESHCSLGNSSSSSISLRHHGNKIARTHVRTHAVACATPRPQRSAHCRQARRVGCSVHCTHGPI